jgi:2-polyprenyl-6-methoxyphenol hydroxylase-like FAD-dependent oxidoreductase
MLGLLLARAGVEVIVIERHDSFLDDFRGDTLQPATLALLDELGLSGHLSEIPTTPISRVTLPDRHGRPVVVADYAALTRWGVPHPYMTLAPQDGFLQILADAATDEPTFQLRMATTVTGLVRDGETVTGVWTRPTNDPAGEEETLSAAVVIGCDGRDSPLAAALATRRRRYRVPFDTWWFRLSRRPGEATGELTRAIGPGRFAVVIPRPTYFQIGYSTSKGLDAALRNRGVAAFRDDVADMLPRFRDRIHEIRHLRQVRHLDVRLERLARWHTSGLLVIGDAAHPMSPVGGVGVHLAIQDAVATARLLTPTLQRHRSPTRRTLSRVCRRRILPTATTQAVQRLLHADFQAALGTPRPAGHVGMLLRSLLRFPGAATLSAYIVGVGIPTEHIHTIPRRSAD